MTAVLITGNPGSGKTSVAAELARRGCAVLDGDDLAGWETREGVLVSPPDPAPHDWLLAHRWVWPRGRVEGAIAGLSSAARPLYLCGIAVNQRDLLDLFDVVFLLTLDHATQIERLDTPANAHRTGVLRDQIVDGRPVFEAEMRAVGAVALDGRLPIPVLADRVVAGVGPGGTGRTGS